MSSPRCWFPDSSLPRTPLSAALTALDPFILEIAGPGALSAPLNPGCCLLRLRRRPFFGPKIWRCYANVQTTEAA